MNRSLCARGALAVCLVTTMAASNAWADDAPSPCSALKRIVAAGPDRFSSLTPDDGKGVAQPYGDDAQCSATRGSYQCTWTPHHDDGSASNGLEAVAADIASCLPEATHDQNSPSRQHFYVGDRGHRTSITAMQAGKHRVKLIVSGGSK